MWPVIRSVHDRDELAALLRRDPGLHAYELGDLDDFFWPYTTWYRDGDAVALVYHGQPLPTLVALAPPRPLAALLSGLRPLLPRHFYAHLSPGGTETLADTFDVDPHGPHHKMVLRDVGRMRAADTGGAVVLDGSDLPELRALYAAAYPRNWFDQRMLETGQYVGVRRDGALLAVAGVHVYSPVYRIAAVGNVTTDPAARGQGLATAATAALCRRLLDTVDVVTLNVKADNAAAIAVYRRLGFMVVADYDESELTARG
jgi:RimJ/RimL family protein N-acetyltransferase